MVEVRVVVMIAVMFMIVGDGGDVGAVITAANSTRESGKDGWG